MKNSTLPKIHTLNIIPPNEHLENYKADYKEMQSSMIHGDTNSFTSLLKHILRKTKKI